MTTIDTRTDPGLAAPETDPSLAPGLMDGAADLELTPEQCDLVYWFRNVPEGTLRGNALGRSPDTPVPDHMRVPGPAREALSQELAFRSLAEEKAARALSFLVAYAPDLPCMDFYSTQLLDEARHALAFRNHLVDLGHDPARLIDTVHDLAAADRAAVLDPLEDFALEIMRDERDFHGGVVVLTVLVEGVLAPAAELSERKWGALDPAAAEIERGACVDEIRHLAVGSAIVRRHLQERPEEKARMLAIIERGNQVWESLPIEAVLQRRELLFQEALTLHADAVGDYEIWAGRKIVDTTPEERMMTAVRWSEDLRHARLAYMGLPEAAG